MLCRYLRSVAYREFSRLVYGFLGKKRIPLPSCAYTAIRKTFPVQEDETLTGFEVEDLIDWKIFYTMVILLPDHQLLFWFQNNAGCSFLAWLLFYSNMILFLLLVVSNTANVLDKSSVQSHTLAMHISFNYIHRCMNCLCELLCMHNQGMELRRNRTMCRCKISFLLLQC